MESHARAARVLYLYLVVILIVSERGPRRPETLSRAAIA